MRTKCLLQLLAFAGIAASAMTKVAAQPPTWGPVQPNISTIGPKERERIEARLNYWKDRFLDADSGEQVREIRQAVMNDYRWSQSSDWQYTFAQIAAEVLTPVTLDSVPKTDPLRAVKQINAGMALSRMAQVTIAPALQKMVAAPNPAVRWLGMAGYRRARVFILAQGQSEAARMLNTLSQAAARENSGPVVGELLRALNVPSFATTAIPEQIVRRTQRAALDIIEANWGRWCRELMAGDVTMATAFDSGVRALRTLAREIGNEGEIRRRILQTLLNAMSCAAVAYDRSDATGTSAQVNAGLLRSAETALNALAGMRETPVVTALNTEQAAERGPAVRLAVIKWRQTLEPMGVQPPQIEPTTRPSPQPADED
jgi:hypothetical protein